jgi:hypothetical protein
MLRLVNLMQITIDHLDVNGETLRFAEPITAEVTVRDGEYFCENEDLSIIAMSHTQEGCIEEFKEEILFVWNEYGKAEDSQLTADAKVLKEKILKHVGR